MISLLKFNELENRVDLLVNRVLELEQQVRTLTESQGGDIPPGMAPVATLAAEFGISTKKAEELAKNTGVMLVRRKLVALSRRITSSERWRGRFCAARSANMDRRTGITHYLANFR